MAIALQTHTNAQGDGNTLVINKPASTVDGDLLVAVLSSSAARTVTTLSGWTLITNGTNTQCNTYSYYKIASSEGASYTWTFSSTGNNYGVIMRVDGHASSGFLTDFAVATGSGTTLTFANNVDPVANSLLIFAVGHSQNDGNSNTISTYAITTSNPSWTELYDMNDTTVDSGGLSVAYATRLEATNTGNYTAASSGADTLAVGILIAVQPPVSVTASPSVITSALSVQDPTVSAGATISPSVVDITTSVIAPTVSFPTPDWTNQSKSSADTWTNQSKS